MANGLGRAMARLAAILALASVMACAPVYRNHGYAPSDEDLAQIQLGSDTRETVAQKLGRPSASGLLNDQGWFWVQSRYKHYGPREPQEIDRQVVAVTFTEAGIVDGVGRYGLQDGRVVPLSRRVTESSVRGLTVLQQLFSNFGRLRADQLLNN